jgi:hypothetical protein
MTPPDMSLVAAALPAGSAASFAFFSSQQHSGPRSHRLQAGNRALISGGLDHRINDAEKFQLDRSGLLVRRSSYLGDTIASG